MQATLPLRKSESPILRKGLFAVTLSGGCGLPPTIGPKRADKPNEMAGGVCCPAAGAKAVEAAGGHSAGTAKVVSALSDPSSRRLVSARATRNDSRAAVMASVQAARLASVSRIVLCRIIFSDVAPSVSVCSKACSAATMPAWRRPQASALVPVEMAAQVGHEDFLGRPRKYVS